jgi:ABC-type amino acid transport substrate-binding protein
VIVRRQRDQRGQILVMAVLVMTFLFVPLAIYLIDSGLVEAAYVQTGEALQAAAEDGAQSLDVTAFRQSGGQVVRLDPDQAKAVADRSLQASQLPGLETWTTTAGGNNVTVTAHVRVSLIVLGTATLTQTRAARFAVGT